jgi:hypothetical protein
MSSGRRLAGVACESELRIQCAVPELQGNKPATSEACPIEELPVALVRYVTIFEKLKLSLLHYPSYEFHYSAP